MLDPVKIYTEIRGDLEVLDKERIKFSNRVRPFKYIFWLLTFAGAGSLVYFEYFPLPFTIIEFLPFAYIATFIIFLILFIGIWQYNLEKFKVIFTDRVAPKIISGMGESFTYEYNGGPSSREISESMLFASFSKYDHQDFIFRLT